MDLENLLQRIDHLEKVVLLLIDEARINNRLAIIGLILLAGGKEIVGLIKNVL